MIISPPFLPASGSGSSAAPDGMMDAVDQFELAHGIYPIAFDRRWHTGVHLMPSTQNERIRAIADGEVVAYRVCQKAIDGGSGKPDSNAGFVLLKHQTETGDGRSITFYSLYMHLLELDGYKGLGVTTDELPDFLQAPSPGETVMVPTAPPPAQAGSGKTVSRKDVLGLAGQCHGQKHFHFEIFMRPDDFNAYFGATQLDKKSPTTPGGTDYWGHTYYIIPAGQSFLATPTGASATGSLNGVTFTPLQGGSNETALHVETFFHHGTKYTSTWSVAADGTRTAFPHQPVADSDYEYRMYDRAMKLYPDCPSDGYELLRFGRILSPQPILTAGAARTTWMRMTFASGKEGYIDVNSDSVIKLSDADFPFFMGWEKISTTNANTPFKNDGMCDADELKKIVKDVAAVAWLPNESEDEDALSRYVKSNDALRVRLKGFVCHAPTEWDSSQNEHRYEALNAPDGFYGQQKLLDPLGTGYSDFLALLKKFQFWDKTGLPSDELWFFHPLQFIRHFRKCGWLSMDEFKQIYTDARYGRHHQQLANTLRNKYLNPLNLAVRKYGMTPPTRLAHFLGQGAVESGWLASMQETSMLGTLDTAGFHGTHINPASEADEATLGHWYGAIPAEDDAWFRSVKFNSHGGRITGSYDWKLGNCDPEDAQKFRGRGFKQLTGRSNYADYWVFRGWLSPSNFTSQWWSDAAYQHHNRHGMTKIPAPIDDPHRTTLPENCIDSGGFYLQGERPGVAAAMDGDSPEAAQGEAAMQAEHNISKEVTHAINGGLLGEANRWEFTRAAKQILS